MRVRATVSANFAGLGGEARRQHVRAATGVSELAQRATKTNSAVSSTASASSAKRLAAGLPSCAIVAGEERHEGGAERAFGEEAAEQVGQAQRDEERVGHRPGAEERRGQHVADEAQDAAHHGIAADRRDRAQQSHAADGVEEAAV